MATHPDQYIRFDWAMKRLLRNKASFGILEGLLTTLLGKQIHIKSLLESESNQEDPYAKQNRVDMLAEDDEGHLFIIEVQNSNEMAYFQRMLFGTSKLVTEYINRGQAYDKVRKIYSVNIVYFQLGHGTDTVYHGKTEFRGIHTGEILSLSPFQRETFSVDSVSDLYPEYYILNVRNFNGVASTPLEEWIHYLKTGLIPADATAPGLEQARERLRLDQMTKEQLNAYYHNMDDLLIIDDNVRAAKAEGRYEGHAEGLEEGMELGIKKGERSKQIEIARNLKRANIDISAIAASTGLTVAEVEEL
ncbi:MAG: Rpn family recombination-promoting nuclease/putative transposase [Prevotellaceae bacterium]|nr:Rpn family recombination-promoting nuclease/putative transposase [Prevotellaceae bacterium]